jgi:aerobic-type carbon monoxide dehydrogenase small subunit (CoxS/CutS family)
VETEIEVNGEPFRLDISPDRRLAVVLRDDLGLTGTKIGCNEGACGACAVLMDDEIVNACLLLAASAQGHRITTIEGLASSPPSSLQRAFHEEDALQCGYCTPGQIVSATALLARTPQPSSSEIRAGMSGNICRCGAYVKIERAIARVAAETS